MVSGIIFLVLFIIFFFVGIVILYKLKVNFTSFYEKAKYKVLIATLILSISLLIRGALNIVRYESNSTLNFQLLMSIVHDTYFAPVFNAVFFLLTDIVPITAQLLSMIFGLMRRNDMENEPQMELHNNED